MADWDKIIGGLADTSASALIGSVDPQGYPEIKAMLAPRKRDGISRFWLTTNTSSLRVAHYRNNPKASIYFFNPSTYKAAMLQGEMEVLEDAASKEMIWQEGDTMYYPKGVTDPDYCVLRFTAKQGRYYSEFHSEDFAVTGNGGNAG